MSYLNILNVIFDKAEAVAEHLRSSGEATQPLSRGAFGDITYVIDEAVEKAIIEVVMEYLPNSLIISEEVGVIGDHDGFPLILIDPIDGSTNAYHNVPLYSSAVTIVEGTRFGDVAAAGVADFIHGERIMSEGDDKVMINSLTAHSTPAKPYDTAYVNVNIKASNIGDNGKWLMSLLRKIKYPRFLGTAALETAYVAIGRSQAYIQLVPNLRTFDCIGALFLVKQGGGWIKCLNTNIDGVDLRKPERFAYIAACDAAMGELIMSSKA